MQDTLAPEVRENDLFVITPALLQMVKIAIPGSVHRQPFCHRYLLSAVGHSACLQLLHLPGLRDTLAVPVVFDSRTMLMASVCPLPLKRLIACGLINLGSSPQNH